MNSPGKSGLLFSVLALTVAVGTAVFTYLQYRVADRARQEIHDDAMQTLRLSYRPYIAARGDLNPQKKMPKGPAVGEVTLRFTVSGSTPALEASFREGCSTFKVPKGSTDRTPQADAWPSEREALPHGVLFPGQTISLHCLTCITKTCRQFAQAHRRKVMPPSIE